MSGLPSDQQRPATAQGVCAEIEVPIAVRPVVVGAVPVREEAVVQQRLAGSGQAQPLGQAP